jgi:hypothetical protein
MIFNLPEVFGSKTQIIRRAITRLHDAGVFATKACGEIDSLLKTGTLFTRPEVPAKPLGDPIPLGGFVFALTTE